MQSCRCISGRLESSLLFVLLLMASLFSAADIVFLVTVFSSLRACRLCTPWTEPRAKRECVSFEIREFEKANPALEFSVSVPEMDEWAAEWDFTVDSVKFRGPHPTPAPPAFSTWLLEMKADCSSYRNEPDISVQCQGNHFADFRLRRLQFAVPR